MCTNFSFTEAEDKRKVVSKNGKVWVNQQIQQAYKYIIGQSKVVP